MTDAALQRLAQRQLADYDAHKPGSAFAETGITLAVEEAYAVQLAVARLRQSRGERVAGYKIGCVSPATQQQIGIEHPVVGHLWDGELASSPAHLPSERFDGPGIEGEFAVRLSSDIPNTAAIAEAPAQFVESVFPVIELHNFVFRGPKPRAAELIANNAVHAGVVLDAANESHSDEPRDISVLINGELRGKANVNPLATLRALAERASALDLPLKAGHILLTGSPLPLYTVEPGDTVVVTTSEGVSIEATIGGAH